MQDNVTATECRG